MPLTSFVARAKVCKQGFDADLIKPIVRVDKLSKPLWMIFSKRTDSTLVAAFRTSLGKLKAAKVDAEIRHVYLENWHLKNCAGR